MNEPNPSRAQPPAGIDSAEESEGAATQPASTPAQPGIKGNTTPETGKGPAKKLTAEEQMALYEEDLKENDWGHQPC